MLLSLFTMITFFEKIYNGIGFINFNIKRTILLSFIRMACPSLCFYFSGMPWDKNFFGFNNIPTSMKNINLISIWCSYCFVGITFFSHKFVDISSHPFLGSLGCSRSHATRAENNDRCYDNKFFHNHLTVFIDRYNWHIAIDKNSQDKKYKCNTRKDNTDHWLTFNFRFFSFSWVYGFLEFTEDYFA